MTDETRSQLEQELYDLSTSLSSPASPIGDWKIAKIQEYVLAGNKPPYDIAELHAKRQSARDRINELQQMLNA